jgi:hypothetical protein
LNIGWVAAEERQEKKMAGAGLVLSNLNAGTATITGDQTTQMAIN